MINAGWYKPHGDLAQLYIVLRMFHQLPVAGSTGNGKRIPVGGGLHSAAGADDSFANELLLKIVLNSVDSANDSQ